MGKWVIICNPKEFDVVGAFNVLENINWKQSTDIQKGDLVYIYVTKPYGEIKFETKVIEVNLKEAVIDDSEYVIDGSNFENYGRYMELQLLKKFDDGLLSYDSLKRFGLKAVQGPSRVSAELEEFILERTSQLKQINDRHYFFVFQNKSYDDEYKGGYMWAPQHGENGRRVPHWDEMKNVRKGDLIIHSYFKKIVAISVAKTDVYESERPLELPDQWNKNGWRVDTEYLTIKNPITTSDHMDELMKLQPKKNAPFNRIGRGNTGYLFSSNKEMSKYIINETINGQKTDNEKKALLDLLKNKENKTIESKLDNELIDEIDNVLSSLPTQEVNYKPEPKKRSEAIINGGNKTYPRDKKIAVNALNRAKHNCEIEETHPSFIRRSSKTKYAEPHHLIPMANQGSFDNSLDVEANIISLCSNCHNQIHYGNEAAELIETLYKKRREELAQAGIPICLEELLKLY